MSQTGTLYHILGYLSSIAYAVPLYGLYLQLKVVWERKKNSVNNHNTTENISLYRTFTSYLAFYANFMLALSLPKFDPYLGTSRFIALVLLMLLFREIKADQKNWRSLLVYFGNLLLLILSIAVGFTNRELLNINLSLIQYFVVFTACLMVHGYYSQIKILIKNKSVGALSKGMYQCFLVKEISTLAFATTLGNNNAWPLYFMHGSVLICEIVILYYIQRFTQHKEE